MRSRDFSVAPATVRQGQIPKRLRKAALFEQLGTGLITGAADDDPSGIATYSQAGAQFGFNMLWTMVLTYSADDGRSSLSVLGGKRRQGEAPKAGRSRSASRRGTREGQESPRRGARF